MNICLRVREKKCLHIATSNLDPPHSTDGFQHMLKLLKRSSTASKERWVGWRVAHPRNVRSPCWLIWKNEVFVSSNAKKKKNDFGYSAIQEWDQNFWKPYTLQSQNSLGYPAWQRSSKKFLAYSWCRLAWCHGLTNHSTYYNKSFRFWSMATDSEKNNFFNRFDAVEISAWAWINVTSCRNRRRMPGSSWRLANWQSSSKFKNI